MVHFRNKQMGKKGAVALKAFKLVTKIPMLAPFAPLSKLVDAMANSVETRELADDIMKWRTSADQEDVDYIKTKGAASEFEKSLAALPKVTAWRMSNLRGITETEVEYLKNLATADIEPGDEVAKESQLKSTAVFHAIKREQAAKGKGKLGKAKGKVSKFARSKVGAGQWDELAPQLLSMTPEQRTKFLNQYPGTTPAEKLKTLREELKNAGIDDDAVGPIVAVFENQYEEAGAKYLELVNYVHSQVYMKSKLGKIKRGLTSPTKAGKADKFGKKVIKLITDLRGNEFAQLRQNQSMLQLIETNSGEHWITIARILGITGSTDQLTGTTSEVVSKAQEQAEQRPEYWATQIEALAVKAKGSFNYNQSSPKLDKKGVPIPPKPVTIKSFKEEELTWVVVRAQSVAQQVEEKSNKNPDAAGFMKNIFNALQPVTQEEFKKKAAAKDPNDKDDIKKAEKFNKIYLALTDQANHPLKAGDAVKKSLKKAEAKWLKRLWRPRPDRVRIVNSFSRLEGKELLDEWSNFREYEHLYEGAEHADELIQSLNAKISNNRKEFKSESNQDKRKALDKEYHSLVLHRDNTANTRAQIQNEMKGFVLGIRDDRNEKLLKMTGLTSDDRLKIIAMLTEKLIGVAENDPEVQIKMLMMDMSFDSWMKTKMRGIDAIEMQRHLDTTRQWHLFSNKSAQLDEGTRRVVGAIRSGNEEMREAEKSNKSVDELQALKSKYTKRGEAELTDRKEVEAAFRDMQTKFNARASLIIRIITTALIMALSVGISAASMGIATPIMLAINGGMLLSQIAIHAAFDYFVLKKPLTQVGLEAGFAILQMALTLMTMNLATAMNASFLHPDLFLKGSEWLAPNISKALSKTILGIITAYPKTVLKMAYEQQPLEDAVAKGKEKAMGKVLGKAFLMGAAKPWLKFVLKGSVGGIMYGVEQAKPSIYEGLYGTPPPTSGGVNQATTPMPTGEQMLSDPGGSIGQGFSSTKDTVDNSIKGFLTPTTPQTPPKGDLLTTFTDPQTSRDNMEKMIKKQKRGLKKYAKKTAVGKKGGWVEAKKETMNYRKGMMDENRERFVKGMRLVEGGTSTNLSTGVTALTTDVRVVFFGGGWRLEDTGTPKTATVNGKSVQYPVPLTEGDRVAVGGKQYSVELGSG
jgi:hypothetical protein